MLAKPQGFPRKLGGCAGLDPRLRSAVSAGVGDGERGLRRGLRAPGVGVRPKWVLEYSPSNKRIRYFVSITYVRTGVWTAHKFCGGGEIIIRRQESAQEPMGSWRLSSLPRTHQAILRSTTGPAVPGSPLRAVRGAGKRPVRSPASPFVRSDCPVIHRSGCCLAIFPQPWLALRGPAQGR